MRTAALLCLIGCGASSSNPSNPSTPGAAKVAPEPVPTIALANVAHGGDWRAAATVMYRDDKLVVIDHDDVFGNPEKSFRGFDARGRLAPASGAWKPAPPDAGGPPERLFVVVDRDVPAAKLRAALAPFRARCVGFLGKHDNVLAAVVPDPCPIAGNYEESVRMAVQVDKDKIMAGLSRIDEVTQLSDRAALAKYLAEQKATAFFADRTDLVLAVGAAATAGDVIELLDLAHGAGFTSAEWVEPSQLPVDLSHARSAPPAHEPAEPSLSLGQPNIVGDLDKSVVRKLMKRDYAKLAACFAPNLAGTVSVQFFVDAHGRVASASVVGGDPAAGTCLSNVIKAIAFPEGSTGSQVKYSVTMRR